MHYVVANDVQLLSSSCCLQQSCMPVDGLMFELFNNSLACCVVLFPSLDGSVALKEFDSSFEGIISSFIRRYPNYDTQLESLWKKDQCHWAQK